MSISKQQWQAIRAELRKSWGHLEFSLNGHKISVARDHMSVSTTMLAVYIDGHIDVKWFQDVSKIDPADELMNQVVKHVYSRRVIHRWNEKQLEEYAKVKRQYGAKFATELYGKQPERQRDTYLRPYFVSTIYLVRRFQRIEGLELVSELSEVAA